MKAYRGVTVQLHLHCCTMYVVSVSSLLFQLMHLLHFKTLKSHTKTLKICPYMFRSPLKPSSGGSWPYFATLLNWNADLHSLWRVSVCGCMRIHSVCVCVCVCVCAYLVKSMSWNPWHNLDQIGTHTHTHRRNELTYSHIPTLFITNVNQHFNSVM